MVTCKGTLLICLTSDPEAGSDWTVEGGRVLLVSGGGANQSSGLDWFRFRFWFWLNW